MGSRAGLGIVLIAVAMMAFGFVFLGTAGGIGGPVDDVTVCDVRLSISAKVRDYNSPIPIPGTPSGLKDVVDWNVPAPEKVAGTCHIKQFWDFSVANVQNPEASLIGEGSTTFNVKLFNTSHQIVKESTFTVNTANQQAERNFTQVVTFTNIPENTYSIEIWHSWKNDGPSYTVSQFTV